jgi:hypothetical protein
MSTNSANATPTHPPYGSEWPEPDLSCPGNTVLRLKQSVASLSREALRQPLDLSVEDHYHTHGLELTLLELERQAHRIARIFAASLQEAEDDGDRASDDVRSDNRRLPFARRAALSLHDEVK